MGRDLEGGFRMGNTCTPMADSYQYTRPIIFLYFTVNNYEKILKDFIYNSIKKCQVPRNKSNKDVKENIC